MGPANTQIRSVFWTAQLVKWLPRYESARLAARSVRLISLSELNKKQNLTQSLINAN